LSDVVVLRRSLLLLIAAAAGSCRRHGPPAGEDEWARWFEHTSRGLTRVDLPLAPVLEGPIVRTPDGVSFRLGSAFQKRNDYGCWAAGTDKWPGPGWRDVCVSRVDPAYDLAAFRMWPEPLDPRMADQHQSEDWQVGLASVGGRRAIVERARVSGGIEGAKRERRINILLELGSRSWAELAGSSGDERGLAELVSIAGTIQSP
jgi:hypothetical protein